MVIAGGTVVTEYDTQRADVVVEDGRIVEIVDDASDRSGERVDATGKLVFPGGVDMHTHLREPSKIEREGFAYGTASAVAGGITTVVEMPQADPLVVDVESFVLKHELASRGSIADFGLYAAAIGQSPAELEALREAGALAFKAFTCNSAPGYPKLAGEGLATCLANLHELDALLIVHAEDDEQLQAGIARMLAEGRTDPRAHAESRPPNVEIDAIATVTKLAEHARARLHVAHVSTAGGVKLVADARANGGSVTCETCPQYLLMDTTDLDRLGPWARCAPALRERAEVELLWDLVLEGEVNAIASDHSPYTYADKEAGQDDIFKASLGLNVIQVMLPAVFSEGMRRGLSLTRFAELSAAGPAKILGLYPRKGSLTVGADADLAIWNPTERWRVSRDQLLSRFPWTPLEGREIVGRVETTIRRGEIVYANGGVLAEPGSGAFIHGRAIEVPFSPVD
jgi:allantoinase